MFKNLLLINLLPILMVACSREAVVPVSLPVSDHVASRGEILANGLAACGFCHTPNAQVSAVFSGGRVLEDRYGLIVSSNLTPAARIGSWNVADVVRAIRGPIDAENKNLATKFHAGYQWLSDSDAFAIASYIKSLPAVENDTPKREIGIIKKYSIGFMDSVKEVKGFIPDIDPKFKLEYGQYLVDHVARCASCHNTPSSIITSERYLGGGDEIVIDGQAKVVPEITSSLDYGLGSWSEDQIVNYLKTGLTIDNKQVDPRYCPVGFYSNALNSDLYAIAAYLKTVQP